MPDPHIHHCSFEIHDTDMQMLSHKYLAQQGYELAWGVGCVSPCVLFTS